MNSEVDKGTWVPGSVMYTFDSHVCLSFSIESIGEGT